jgi:Protein of unknown function (DUF2892)
MQCNIDAKGKAVRLVIGTISLLAGAGLLAAWWTTGAEWALYTGIGAALGGAFGIFEGAAGWCVVRAMGMRTPI